MNPGKTEQQCWNNGMVEEWEKTEIRGRSSIASEDHGKTFRQDQ